MRGNATPAARTPTCRVPSASPVTDPRVQPVRGGRRGARGPAGPSSPSSRRSSATACRARATSRRPRTSRRCSADAGVVPATIAVLDGVPRVGLDAAGLERIANEDMAKASVRDLPMLAARGGSAATTVAATTRLAALAGVRVFATGGLGGVHRGVRDHLRRVGRPQRPRAHPVAVVTAGVKSVLDIGGDARAPRDPVGAGRRLRHGRVPELLAADSGLRSTGGSTPPRRSPRSCARRTRSAEPGASLVVREPGARRRGSWDPAEHDRVLAQAFAAADAAKVRGKAVTPFLLVLHRRRVRRHARSR